MCLYFLKKFNLSETVNFWSVLGTILNKKIDELKIYKNVIIVDPRKILTSSEQNFTDYIHLTPKGNGILANEISKKSLKTINLISIIILMIKIY